MKYRDILGFSKPKRKTTKKSVKPQKNKLIESINREIHDYPIQQFERLKEQEKELTDIPDSPFANDKEDDVKPGSMNETIPAYAKEWKNLEKACYALEKSVKVLGKAVEKQDKKKGKL